MRRQLFGMTVALGCAFSTFAAAQSISSSSVPAELPPASFTGRQYVDSKGCVYIRAGISGVTNWVPRVSRKRNVICGQTPTFAGNSAPAPRAPIVREPVAVAAAAPVVVPVPQRVVRQAAPQVVRAPRQVVRQVAPVAVVPTYSANPVYQGHVTSTPGYGTVNRVNLGGRCPGRSAVSQAYTNPDARCGSQGWTPGSAGRVVQGGTYNHGTYGYSQQGYGNHTTYSANRTVVYAGGTHIPPHRGYGTTVLQPGIVYQGAPSGTKNTWEDGRLNPLRGIRGQQVYQPVNNQGYYYNRGYYNNNQGYHTGASVQPGATWYPPRPTVSTRGAAAAVKAPVAVAQPRAVVPRQVAAAPSRSVQVGAGHRWVQVGSFGNPQNAQATAHRLQRLGLPVRIGRASTYQVVLIGPYSNMNALGSALTTARRAGYGSAYTRK